MPPPSHLRLKRTVWACATTARVEQTNHIPSPRAHGRFPPLQDGLSAGTPPRFHTLVGSWTLTPTPHHHDTTPHLLSTCLAFGSQQGEGGGGAESDKNPLVWAEEMRCCSGNGDMPTLSGNATTPSSSPIVGGWGLEGNHELKEGRGEVKGFRSDGGCSVVFPGPRFSPKSERGGKW